MEMNPQPPADHPADEGAASRPTRSEDGVDLTLIRWMLSLTPAERLEALRRHNQAIARLRDLNENLR